jgi:hypothetical protein
MAEQPKPQSWWQTLPGILTATAAFTTAITGLVVALHQAGFFQDVTKSLIHKISPPGTPQPSQEAGPGRTASSLQPLTRAQPTPKRTNLLSSENGGHLVAAASDDWVATIDGKEGREAIHYRRGRAEAVYAFKDERPATFGTFTMLIPGTDSRNVKEFELLVGNDSPIGAFESIGKFQTQNVKLFKTPYQEFQFPVVTARYLKVKILSDFGGGWTYVYEFQLFGSLE